MNLTRFSLFFPEKRDFFLENSGVFQFGTPGNGGGGPGAGRTDGLPDNVLFFSRTIGLSADAPPLPMLGGTRLTGHSGDYTIGALNIQQRRSAAAPATNVTAVRVRRNVFKSSDVGVMVLNKQDGDGGYNRLAGADANFWFLRNLNLSAFAAETASPESVVGTRGRALMWRRRGTATRGYQRVVQRHRRPVQRRARVHPARRHRPRGRTVRPAPAAPGRSTRGCASCSRTTRWSTSRGPGTARSTRGTWTSTCRSPSRTARSSRSARTPPAQRSVPRLQRSPRHDSQDAEGPLGRREADLHARV